MKQESTASDGPLLPSSSSRRCWWWWDGNHPFLLVSFVVFCLCSPWCAVDGSCAEDGVRGSLAGDGCASYGDSAGSGSGWRRSAGRCRPNDMCAGSGAFCFPSILMGFLSEEDSSWNPSFEAFEGLIRREEIGSSWYQGNGNRGFVSCYLKDSGGGIHHKLHSENKNDEEGVASCRDPRLPDFWIQSSSADRYEHSKEIETGFANSSSSPHVEISPPVLDWGTNTLYSPSLAFLNVGNAHKNGILHVHDLFSSDMQFYPYGFEKIALEPGKSAMIPFVFLPRWLGSSSAYFVMQTNLGGFVIKAKGAAIESPYHIEPFVGLQVSSYGSLSRSFSLYNPSDDVLHVEEVTLWISTSSDSIDHSAHVFCSINASHQSSDAFTSFLPNEEWLTVKSGDHGQPWIDIRPHKQWEVPPHNAEAIIEMNLLPHLEGGVFGAICMQLRSSTQDKSDTVIVPIEVEVQGRKTYNDLTGSLSVFLELLVQCAGRGSIFSLSVRNDASYLLTVAKITEVTEGSKLFHVNYMEGLILYPMAVTRIALISCDLPADPHSTTSEVPSVNFNCELLIMTNDSTSLEIKIPCQDLVRTCCMYQTGSSSAAPEGSYTGLMLQQEKEDSLNTRSGSLGSIVEEVPPKKTKLLEVVEADELMLTNWRSQGTMSEMSVLEDHEVLFPVVQIGTHLSKWITVRNPSQKPVIMQLVLSSGAVVDHCKSDDDLSEFTLSSRFGHSDSSVIQDGFSIAGSAVTEAFVHPLDTASFGPVVFRPSKRCMWRSAALIKNNLSGVEWVPLRAFGGSHSLIVLEGSEPVRKLEFNLDLPFSVNISSLNLLSEAETTSASCSHRLSKELYAKNIGELPVDVLRLEISGSNFGLGGFTMHNFKGFALAPGESVKLLISYQADFSAAVVHRDLELAMATGMFVIPMKAVLPVEMLNLCRKSLFRSLLWILSLLLLAAIFLAFLMFLRSDYYFVKNDNTATPLSTDGKPYHLHRNTKKSNSRPVGEVEKPETAYTSRYSNCPNGVHDGKERMQHQKKNRSPPPPPPPPPSNTKSLVVVDDSDVLEARHSADLTGQVVRERGKRRKRRATGATLAAKFEVSSSQSGNSTPSSPLSPNATTTKQIWPQSPDTAENRKRDDPEVAKVTAKSIGRPALSFSATFPGPGCRAPDAAASDLLVSTSPIAPHARAPGSKLIKDKAIKRVESDVVVKEFTYDIWGNNFSDRFLRRPKEITSKKVFDASEGDSQSFFAREPPSLVMMTSARSLSPGHKLPSYDVNHLYLMD